MLTGHRKVGAALVGALVAVTLMGVGLTAPSQAVVHGDSANPQQFPFLLALAEKVSAGSGDTFKGRYNQFCGASLVSPRKAITAAHCLEDRTWADGELVVVATPAGSKAETDAQLRVVSHYVIHPGYDRTAITNDIAVLTLDAPMIGIPAVVPSSDDSALSEADVWSAGWGSIKKDTATPEYPDVFRVAPMVVFPETSCGAANPDPFTIGGYDFNGLSSADVNYAKQICAQGYQGGQIVDTCIGDSGGPLVAGSDGNTRLVGLVSWGPDVCASDDPGVYTRISAYRSFLEGNGVSFDVPATYQPDQPVVVSTTPSPGKLTVKVHAAATGDHPSAFWATATDSTGARRFCVVAAPSGTSNANCVISGLTNGTHYRVTSWAEIGWGESTRTAGIVATPAGKPDAPRIDVNKSVLKPTYALLKVTGFVTNGAAITARYVKCTARNHPTIKAAVGAKGIAKASPLVRGGKYSCKAFAVNIVGTSPASNAVTFTAG